MKSEFEYELEINVHKLDEECIKQPTLFVRYSKWKAEAKKSRDTIWQQCKIKKAQLIKQCLEENPKATMNIQESYYRDNKEHQELKEQLIEADYELELMDGAVQAFRQRKDMLQELIRLYVSDYYSVPGLPRELKEQARDQMEEKQRKKMKRRRELE